VRADEGFHLAREDAFETVVVAGGGEHRSVGGESQRGKARAFSAQANDEFRGEVLGVGGAAAIAEEDEFAAAANGGRGTLREFSHASDQRVGEGLLDAGAFRQLTPDFFGVRGHEVLTEDDFRAVADHPASGVARVDDQLGGIHNGAEVVAGMIGGNEHGVVPGERFALRGTDFMPE